MASPRLQRKEHHDRLVLHELDHTDHRREFQEAVEAGLSASPKTIPPKFFYDARGSELFEQITQTPEYYPTRTEAEILAENAGAIVQAAGSSLGLVELGSGSSAKTRLLLDVLTQRQDGLEYTPIDISPSIVAEHGLQLLEDYPTLRVRGLICDYHQAMQALQAEHDTPRLFLFLGSSICNFAPAEARHLLSDIAATMNPRDRLLLGMDLKKDRAILEAAYNDAQGVTAAFNLNLLAHINHALGGRFDLERFEHRAFFNAAESRIEMHLESLEHQIVPVEAIGRQFTFRQGETIHTENSYKHDPASLDALYEGTGLKRIERWTDRRRWFALDLLAAREG